MDQVILFFQLVFHLKPMTTPPSGVCDLSCSFYQMKNYQIPFLPQLLICFFQLIFELVSQLLFQICNIELADAHAGLIL